MKDYEAQVWRINRYYNEKVDNFLKAHLPILDALYKTWAPRKDPGRKEYIYMIYLVHGWF